MTTPIPLWERLDLKRDAVLEASAGTGKTYTIQKLVLRMLCEDPSKVPGIHRHERLHLDEILVVTFTEKATEELKVRIREELEDHLRSLEAQGLDHALAEHLRANLSSIDRAPIQTIHGFCHSVLRSNAFEAGVALSAHMVDDKDGLKQEIRRQIRKSDEATLEVVMPKLKARKGMGNMANLAGKLKGKGFVLEPGQAEHLDLHEAVAKQPLDKWEKELQGQFDTFRETASRLVSKVEKVLSAELQSLFNAAPTAKKLYLRLQGSPVELHPYIEADLLPMEYDLGTKPPSKSIPAKAGRAQEAVDTDPDLGEAFALWDRLYELGVSTRAAVARIESHRALSFLLQVSRGWEGRKASGASMSFDDLITALSDALERDSGLLLQRLQDRFTCGIIDEFQDTDARQWSIFDRIFRQREKGSAALTVVGDPKQAIYRFRGADLNAYLRAKADMVEGGAQLEPLGRNYRSTPAMIQAANAVFESKHWFEGGNAKEGISGVDYQDPVLPGQEAPEYRAGGAQAWCRAPLQLCDLRIFKADGKEDGRVPVASKQRAYAKWVCERVKALVPEGAPSTLTTPSLKGDAVESRAIERGDIAVLFETRKEALALKKAFDEAKIPWREYAQEGVLSSMAARQWVAILEAISAPNESDEALRRVTLGWFFAPGLGIDGHGELLPSARVSLQRWRELAVRRQWARLLQSIVTQSGVELRLLEGADADRKLSDLRQIKEMVLKHLLLGGADLSDTARWLKRAADGEVEEGRCDVFQLESDRSKVLFLSMHRSKGLEFPVTILMPKMTPKKHSEPFDPVEVEGGKGEKLVAPWATSTKEMVKREDRFERARLLYVAMTRAVVLQFMPLPKGEWPYSTLLGLAQDEAIHGIRVEKPDHGIDLPLTAMDPEPHPTLHQAAEPQVGAVEKLELLFDSIAPELRRFRFQTSFSGMQVGSQKASSSYDEDREIDRAQEGRQDSLDAQGLLPGGRETGNLVHDIFENEDWALLQVPQLMTWLASKDGVDRLPPELRGLLERVLGGLVRHDVCAPVRDRSDEERHLTMAKEAIVLAAHTLSAPLPMEESFRLSDLVEANRIPELEFRLSLDGEGRPTRRGKAQGWLLGFMDLVFRVPLGGGGFRYHVLDWKTNTLPDYSTSSIDACMIQKQYDLQADVYAYALDRWLEGRVKDYDRELHFGGAIYAFVRGQAVEPNGTCFWKREYKARDLQALPERIAKGFSNARRRAGGTP